MAFSTKELLDAMIADSKLRLRALQVDGGVSANDLLMQFQADLLGVPVARPDVLEVTVLGAAALAGLGGGVWKGTEDFLKGRTFTHFKPGKAKASVRAREAEWRRAVDTALHWATSGATKRR
jgi:glycerol kinase